MKKTTIVSRYRAPSWDISIQRPGKWGNPHRLEARTPLKEAECLLAHAKHLEKSGLIDMVHELRGKVLACTCSPAKCHGDTLVRCADAEDARAELGKIIEELMAEVEELRERAWREEQPSLF